MDADVRLAKIAARQRSLVTRAQCLRAGLDDDGIAVRVASHGWSRFRPGVYALPGSTPSWEQTVLAVVLPFDQCWISHGTAARLEGLPNAPEIGRIEILRPYGLATRLEGVTSHRSRIIVPADVTRTKRIPVTSIGRTIVDCSGRLTVPQTGKMLDAAIRRSPKHLEDTRACFARLAGGGRRRLRSIRAVLAHRIPGYDPGDSDLEIETLRMITAAGLPIPVQQHRVVLYGKRYRIDLAYPTLKIAIELQSWSWHGGREAFDDDKARTADLVAHGWRVLEITARHGRDEIIRWLTDTVVVAAAA